MIYLNNASTTSPEQSVLEDFMYCAENMWNNPSDASQLGLNTKEIIYEAQKKVADSIGSKAEEIIFTSGGSESNNLAIKGFLSKNFKNGFTTIITSEIEHPSVYNTCKYMEQNCNCRVFYVKPDECGVIDPNDIEYIIGKYNIKKPLVSIMMANNEIGTIQQIKQISDVVHKYGGVLHTDAVQAYMHIFIDVDLYGIDMMSTSFHKYGGLKGGGFLYVRDGIELDPLIHGGHQFESLRAGTENVPLIYAMGEQIRNLNRTISVEDGIGRIRQYIYDADEDMRYSIRLKNKIVEKCSDLCEINFNGHSHYRLPGILSVSFKGINASNLITLLEDNAIYVSAGSACCSGENTPSRILKAIGLSDEDAFSTIRISIRDIIDYKIDEFVDCLKECIMHLQILT